MGCHSGVCGGCTIIVKWVTVNTALDKGYELEKAIEIAIDKCILNMP